MTHELQMLKNFNFTLGVSWIVSKEKTFASLKFIWNVSGDLNIFQETILYNRKQCGNLLLEVIFISYIVPK